MNTATETVEAEISNLTRGQLVVFLQAEQFPLEMSQGGKEAENVLRVPAGTSALVENQIGNGPFADVHVRFHLPGARGSFITKRWQLRVSQE